MSLPLRWWLLFSISPTTKTGHASWTSFSGKPFEEDKIVRCTKGLIYDVAVDLRSKSPTFRRWFAVELSEENRLASFIPKGFAHGFQTLVDGSEVLYQMSEFYHPEAQAGVRWNDPAFGIRWPLPEANLSAKDAALPNFAPI
jgi:dTDP-4-dehydrorhamnose 3,5-epimerase